MNRLPDKVLWEPRVDIFDQAGSNDCGILRRKQCLPLQCTQECKYIQEIDNGINGATHSVAVVEREREDGETGFGSPDKFSVCTTYHIKVGRE